MGKPAAKPPLATVAYEKIYRRIMTLAYAPGHHLEEKQLMDELGIGRTPIREALLRLSADFMVESQPSKGVVVRAITLQGTKAVFAALKIFELGVADLAVRQDVSTFIPQMDRANEAVMAAGDGDAKGEKGVVVAKHGGIEHILVDFQPGLWKRCRSAIRY